MITTLPDWIEGIDWRELPPREGLFRWRFQLLRDLIIRVDLPLRRTITLHDAKGHEWARWDGRYFTLRRGYAWNGNSPKRHVPLFGWIGTPDCRGDVTGIGGNILASCVHDGMRQFSSTLHFPLTVPQVDTCFYDINKLSRFPLALPYFSAVRAAAAVWPRGRGGEYSRLVEP
jgi:hypothetical protein